MAYTINKTDGTIVATVEDGVLDNTTSISLIGRNYQSYGEPFNENLIKLLENSASSTAPSSPIKGELWFDSSASQLNVYDGSNFNAVGVRSSGTAPTTSLSSGTLWNDTTNDQLYMYDGSAFDLIGPIYKTGDGKSGWLVDEESLSGGGTANVVSLYQDGTRVAILTATQRALSAVPSGFGSATINAGLTFYEAGDSTTFRLHGTAQNALELGGRPQSVYLVNDQNQTTSGTFGVLNDTGLTIGEDSDATLSISSNNLVITQNNADEAILFRINKASTVTTALEVTDLANVRVYGDLQVDGSLTTTGSSSTFEDNTLVLNNDSPPDSNDQSGLDIRGSSSPNNVTFFIQGDGGPFRSSSGLSVATGKGYDVAGTSVLNATTLGSTVVSSSLTSVGVLNSGSINSGFGDIHIGSSTLTCGSIVMSSDANDDSSTVATISNFSNDGRLESTSPDATILSETAIKNHVSQSIAGTDLVFELDTTGLSNSDITTILGTAAPSSSFPNGKVARIISLTLTSNSSSSLVSGSIGHPSSVSTTTTLTRTRANDLIFTLTNGTWSYTSGG